MYRKELKQAAKEAIAPDFPRTRNHTLVFVLLALAITVAQNGISLISVSTTAAAAVFSGISLILGLLLAILAVGYMSYIMDLCDGQDMELSDLFSSFRIAGRVILLYVLILAFLFIWAEVISLIPIFFLAGQLTEDTAVTELNRYIYLIYLFILAVMFICSYRYRGAFFLLVDHPEWSPARCRRMAMAINRGFRFELFLLDLSFLPWILLCVLTCGILLIWKLPYFTATYYGAYQRMVHAYDLRQSAARGEVPPQG